MSGERQRPWLSVIIPALNEEARIAGTVAIVRQCLPEAEVIVVDGGSDDSTPLSAAAAGASVIESTRGRGLQCHAGAEAARGEILFFLHADTLPPTNAGEVLTRAFARSSVNIGTFRLVFDDHSRFLRACAWLTRFDSVFTRFGDQGIVIRREFYTRLGGFPPWPLFEDVELLRRARRITRVWSFPACVTTSARRFRRHGSVGQQLFNARLLLRFLAGASPEKLAAEYRVEPSAKAARAATFGPRP
ncbi:MAG: TIGR04283 family arsenosugar biosynthesis glycosyltransferase [Opitutaceae bacterium]